MYGLRAATRYAKALLEYAIEKNVVEQVFNDMCLVEKTVEDNKDLERLLTSPIVKNAIKKNVLDEVFKSVSPEVHRLFKLLNENRRLPLLKTVAEKFAIQYNTYKNNQTATVITAVPLTDDLKKQVLQKVEELTKNKNITLENKVDPSLIGGYILRVGDVQYNASIAFKLNRLKQDFQEKLFV